jgi:hypothetical protein
MDCPRCHGLMVPTRLKEGIDARSGECFFGWKCVLCGEVIDSLIMANRKTLHDLPPHRDRPCSYMLATRSRGLKRRRETFLFLEFEKNQEEKHDAHTE